MEYGLKRFSVKKHYMIDNLTSIETDHSRNEPTLVCVTTLSPGLFCRAPIGDQQSAAEFSPCPSVPVVRRKSTLVSMPQVLIHTRQSPNTLHEHIIVNCNDLQGKLQDYHI